MPFVYPIRITRIPQPAKTRINANPIKYIIIPTPPISTIYVAYTHPGWR